MATTTEYKPGVGYKTTDENGKVTYSQSPPNTSTPQSSNAEGGFASNKTKGVVVVIDPITKKPISIPTINGEIDPAFLKKQRDETQKRIYKQFQEQVAAEAKAKEAAELAALAEKERLKISNNYGVTGEVGCKPEVTGAPGKKYEFGIGKPGSKGPGNVTVYNPETKMPFTPDAAGCKVSIKVDVNAPNVYERVTGDAKNAQRARDAVEKTKEIKDEANKIKENVKNNIKNGMPPEAVNEQFMRESAELIKKYGKEAANAALK